MKALLHGGGRCRARASQALRGAVARARAAEVPAEQAWAAAAALGLARGEEVAGRLVAELLAHYGPPEPGVAPAQPLDAAAAEAYFRDYFGGELPERVALLAEQLAGGLRRATRSCTAACCATARSSRSWQSCCCARSTRPSTRPTFLEIHARAARGAGASEAELVEAVVAVIPVAGIAAWAASAGALGADLTAPRRRARCRGRASRP